MKKQQSLPCGAGLRPARTNPVDSSPALLKPHKVGLECVT